MVIGAFHPKFRKMFSKIKDAALKDKIMKQTAKLKENPELGKPMMYSRKGTRELYIPPYRLSYVYIKEEDKIVFLDLYHKDEQ
jgi:mRNA-degrading endonuclease RelE of RelBE toxin-antitoxin system